MDQLVAVLGTVNIAMIGWMLAHSIQCNKIHERVAKLEQHLKDKDDSR